MATARRRRKSTPRRSNPAPRKRRARARSTSRTIVRRVKRRHNPAGISPTMAAVIAAAGFAIAPMVIGKVQESIADTVNPETSGLVLGLGALVGGVMLAKKSPIAAGALAGYGGSVAGLLVRQKMSDGTPATAGIQVPGLGGVQVPAELGAYSADPWDRADVGEASFVY